MGEMIPDYPLSTGFLRKLMRASLEDDYCFVDYNDLIEDDLPVRVQIIQVSEEQDGWKCVQVSDGQALMTDCGFVTKEKLPPCYSIIEILTINCWNIKRSPFRESAVRRVFGEIKFAVHTDGHKIGHPLYVIDATKHFNLMNLQDVVKSTSIDAVLKNIEYIDPTRTMMEKLWKNGLDKFSDVQFTFPEEDDVLYGHKNILVSCSDVFEAHFEQSRGVDYTDQTVVAIVDAKRSDFKKLLQFLYTGEVQFTTVAVAMEMLYLAKKYFIPSLETQARGTVEVHMLKNPESVLEVLHLNETCHDETIKNEIVTVLQKSARLVIKSESFLVADFAAVEWILAQNKLMVDEWSLLQALFRWAVFNGVTVTCNGEDAEHQDCLHQLFECIQFDKVGRENLRRFLLCSKLGDLVPLEEFKSDVLKQVYLENKSRPNEEHSVFREVESGSIKDRFSFEMLVPTPLPGRSFFRHGDLKIELTDGEKFKVMFRIVGKEDKSGYIQVKLSFSSPEEEMAENYKISMSVTENGYILAKKCVFALNGSRDWLTLVIKDYQKVFEQRIEEVGLGSDLKNVINLEIQICED